MTEVEKQNEYQQVDWLRDAVWQWSVWSPPQPDWDHDHCFFCQVHFCDKPDCRTGLRECWHSELLNEEQGSYETVCAACFEQFKETFRWKAETGE